MLSINLKSRCVNFLPPSPSVRPTVWQLFASPSIGSLVSSTWTRMASQWGVDAHPQWSCKFIHTRDDARWRQRHPNRSYNRSQVCAPASGRGSVENYWSHQTLLWHAPSSSQICNYCLILQKGDSAGIIQSENALLSRLITKKRGPGEADLMKAGLCSTASAEHGTSSETSLTTWLAHHVGDEPAPYRPPFRPLSWTALYR